MPISFRDSTFAGAGSTTVVSIVATMTGTRIAASVHVHDASTANAFTSLQQDGVSFSQVGVQNNEYQSGRQLRTYGLHKANASTSAPTSFTLTMSGAMTAIGFSLVSYDGINSTISTGRTGGGTGNSTTHGVSVTVDGSSSIILVAITKKDPRTGPFAAGSSTTQRIDASAGSGSPANQIGLWFGDQAAPSTGAHVSSATSSAAENWSMFGFELRESTVVSGPFTAVPELRLLGVGT